jgi:hypothetical protein
MFAASTNRLAWTKAAAAKSTAFGFGRLQLCFSKQL